jgi:hypothetical protein
MESFEEGISFTLVLLLDVLDLHQHHSLGSTDHYHTSGLALGALQPEGDLFGGFSFLSEDGLCLSSVSGLFAIISASTLGSLAFLALLVLSNLVHSVGQALAAVGLSGLGDNNH